MNRIKKFMLLVLCSTIMIGAPSMQANAASFVIPGYIHYGDTGLYEQPWEIGLIVMMKKGSRVDIDSTNYNDQVALSWMYVKHAASSQIGYCDAHALRL